MKIAFHGSTASTFRPGIEDWLTGAHDIVELPDLLETDADRQTYVDADIVIGIKLDKTFPRPGRARLYQVPGAGYDGIDRTLLPAEAVLCNCFGHENAIAEYVFAALLARHVPLGDADRRLRDGDWAYWAGGPAGLRTELGGTTLGLLGFGHIGQALAARGKAFGMTVVVANRSPVSAATVDTYLPLADLTGFMRSADAIVNTLPLTDETRGLIGADALAAMRGDAVIVNVGRGPVIDESALYAALKERRIGGAVIDTWYVYPGAESQHPQPSLLPFRELDNVVMTPHMSGWTHGTIRRRQQTIAANINHLVAGTMPDNIVR